MAAESKGSDPIAELIAAHDAGLPWPTQPSEEMVALFEREERIRGQMS